MALSWADFLLIIATGAIFVIALETIFRRIFDILEPLELLFEIFEIVAFLCSLFWIPWIVSAIRPLHREGIPLESQDFKKFKSLIININSFFRPCFLTIACYSTVVRQVRHLSGPVLMSFLVGLPIIVRWGRSRAPLTQGALPPGALSTACRSTYGNRADGSSKEPVLGRVSREGLGEHWANPSLLPLTTGAPRGFPYVSENREVTMQNCIQLRKAKLCLYEWKKNWLWFGFLAKRGQRK